MLPKPQVPLILLQPASLELVAHTMLQGVLVFTSTVAFLYFHLITPHNAQTTSNNVTSSCSHHALRSRHSTTKRTDTANRVRQPHQLHANQCHVHLIEIKYCEETRPQHQLDAAKQQDADLCKYISAKAVTIHPILLGVGGT
eukprot:837504-Pelagomonas_calceolata.AAC.1